MSLNLLLISYFLLNVLVLLTLQLREEAPGEHINHTSCQHHRTNNCPPNIVQDHQSPNEEVGDTTTRRSAQEASKSLKESVAEKVELGGEDDDAEGYEVEEDEVPADVVVVDHLVGAEEASGEGARDGDGFGDVDGGVGAAAFAVETAFLGLWLSSRLLLLLLVGVHLILYLLTSKKEECFLIFERIGTLLGMVLFRR